MAQQTAENNPLETGNLRQFLGNLLNASLNDFDNPRYWHAWELNAVAEETIADAAGVTLLHMTRPEFAETIRKEGLRANDGMIFFVDDARVLGSVALGQIFAQEFHLFAVQPPGTWKLEPNDVAELTAPHQWFYRGNRISPRRLIDLGRWRAVPPVDQFIPPPPEAREQVPMGFWPPGVLAYIEPIQP